MATAKPHRPVRGSSTGRPLMAAMDLLGRRWALRILWELRSGERSFRSLREACDSISPSVLNARLGELREAGLVTLGDGGYALTPVGERLGGALEPLDRWAQSWSRSLKP